MKNMPPKDANLKAFMINCTCKADNNMGHEKKCDVEKIFEILHSHNALGMILDVIDIQPIAYMNDEAEDVRHNEMGE